MGDPRGELLQAMDTALISAKAREAAYLAEIRRDIMHMRNLPRRLADVRMILRRHVESCLSERDVTTQGVCVLREARDMLRSASPALKT